MYKLETVIFNNGERFPLLINKETGLPDFYSTLWVTLELRSQSAVNTIRNKLQTILWLMQWETNTQLSVVDFFQNEIIMNDSQLEGLVHHMRLNAIKQKNKTYTKSKVFVKGTVQFINNYSVVSFHHQYNRLTTIYEYFLFLSKLIQTSIEYKDEIDKLLKFIKHSRPKNRISSSVNINDELPDLLLDEFMAIANYTNPNNPFRNIGIRKRNHLMFALLKDLGIRRGELLSIQIPFIDTKTAKPSLLIKRTHDDDLDTRKVQGVAKTKERKLPISNHIANLIDDYIMNYRSKIPNANKHPYLFVTHKKGKTQGNPISISSFDNIIVAKMKKVDPKFAVIHPHIFRHEWNLNFSRKIDKNNHKLDHDISHKDFISPEKEAKMRQHLMGHASEKSGDIYNKRYIRETANQISLELQMEFQQQIKQNGENNDS